MRNPLSSLTLGCATLVAVGSLAFAHPPGHRPNAPAATPQATPPGSGRNLQVLPADIPQPQLFTIMRSWAQALGVECGYCHVPGDFRSDANPHKNIARGMVRMTNSINNELLPPVVGLAEQARVTCATCHRGSPDPELPPPPEPRPAGAPPPVSPPVVHIAPDTPAKPH